MEVDEKGEYGVEAVAACKEDKKNVKSISKQDKHDGCHVRDRYFDNFYLYDKKYVK